MKELTKAFMQLLVLLGPLICTVEVKLCFHFAYSRPFIIIPLVNSFPLSRPSHRDGPEMGMLHGLLE